jgi:hypothetical protein
MDSEIGVHGKGDPAFRSRAPIQASKMGWVITMSKPAPGHKIYPYLLRGVKVEKPNQVWATDITYIPMARGFVYLVAIVDWFTMMPDIPETELDQIKATAPVAIAQVVAELYKHCADRLTSSRRLAKSRSPQRR